MKAELQQLVALQNLDTRIRTLEKDLEAIPERRAEIEREFDQRAFEIRALENRRDEAKHTRARLENDVVEQKGRAERAEHCVNYYHVAPGYFSTMQTRIVAGRDFTLSDDAESTPVIIVNRAFARRVFGTENVLGKRIGAPDRWTEIVGIVQDGRYLSLIHI